MVTAAEVFAAAETHMGGPLIWGESDCAAAACSVFKALRGVDPMASLRGSYGGAMAAARLMRRAGGITSLAARLAKASGLVPCAPEPGAIGLVPNGRGHAAAICIEPGKWAVKAAVGFAVLDREATAWRRH